MKSVYTYIWQACSLSRLVSLLSKLIHLIMATPLANTIHPGLGEVVVHPLQHVGTQRALSTLGLLGLLLLTYYTVVVKKRVPLPPGPKGQPVLGMSLLMPQDRPWVQLSEWAKYCI